MARPQNGFYPEQHGYGEGYPMQAYPAPPPGKSKMVKNHGHMAYFVAYNAEHAPPPVYQPPEGGSKVNPSQDYAPPPGPPPGHIAEEESSSAMHNIPLSQAEDGQANPASDLPPRAKKPGFMSRLNPFK